MSLALSTLVLFFLLIPGVIFRRFYYSEEFSREYFKQTFFAVFISTIIPSLFFHTLWFFLVKAIGQNVSLYVIGDIVSERPSENSFLNIQNNAWKILLYNFLMFLVAGLSGWYLKKYVRTNKLDRHFKFFRFQNSWHYILKGEFFDFPRAEITLKKDTVEDIEFIYVDAIIEINGASYLYDGILVDYELTNVGSGLDTISLRNAQRRKLNDDSKISKKGNKKDNSKKYYPLIGHILVLKYCELKNINFTYLTLDFEDEEYYIRMVE